MPSRKKLIIRLLSAVLIATFSFTELGRAAVIDAVPILPSNAQQLLVSEPTRFEPPLDFVSLKEIRKGSAPVFIIHIQDAHSNLSGQENLANTLDYLMTRYNVSLILSEGGSNDCSLTSLKKMAPAAVWKMIAKSYLVQGLISGEEYLNLVSDRPMKIIGIEDVPLYLKSVENYAKLAKQREGILAYLDKIENGLEKLKKSAYPGDLQEYEKRKAGGNESFEAGFKAFLDLVQAKQMDLSAYPNLVKLVAIQKREKEIDFNLANLEQARLIEEISSRGGQSNLEQHFDKMNLMKDKRLSQHAYFQNVFEIANAKGVGIGGYPNVVRYAEYLKDFSEIDLELLLGELSRAEDALYLKLLEPGDARLVRAIDRYVSLLDVAYNIQMSTDDFRMFETNEPDFATVAFLAFVNRKLAEAGYFQDIVPFKPELELGRDSLKNFYESVAQRDDAFLKNTGLALNREKQDVAVLISGGYHTANLTKLFSQSGYSYAVMTPIVTSETNQRKYERLLLDPIVKSVKKISVVQGESRLSGKSLSSIGKLPSKKTDGVRRALVATLTNIGLDQADVGAALDKFARGGNVTEEKARLTLLALAFEARLASADDKSDTAAVIAAVREAYEKFMASRDEEARDAAAAAASEAKAPAGQLTPVVGTRLPEFKALTIGQKGQWDSDEEIARAMELSTKDRMKPKSGVAPVTEGIGDEDSKSTYVDGALADVLKASAQTPGRYSFDNDLTGARVLVIGPGWPKPGSGPEKYERHEVVRLIRRYPNMAELHIADVAPEVFQGLDDYLTANNIPHPPIIVHRTDASRINLAKESIDVAIDANVFHGSFFSDEHKRVILEGIVEMLKPLGVHFSIGVFHLDYYYSLFDMKGETKLDAPMREDERSSMPYENIMVKKAPGEMKQGTRLSDAEFAAQYSELEKLALEDPENPRIAELGAQLISDEAGRMRLDNKMTVNQLYARALAYRRADRAAELSPTMDAMRSQDLLVNLILAKAIRELGQGKRDGLPQAQYAPIGQRAIETLGALGLLKAAASLTAENSLEGRIPTSLLNALKKALPEGASLRNPSLAAPVEMKAPRAEPAAQDAAPQKTPGLSSVPVFERMEWDAGPAFVAPGESVTFNLKVGGVLQLFEQGKEADDKGLEITRRSNGRVDVSSPPAHITDAVRLSHLTPDKPYRTRDFCIAIDEEFNVTIAPFRGTHKMTAPRDRRDRVGDVTKKRAFKTNLLPEQFIVGDSTISVVAGENSITVNGVMLQNSSTGTYFTVGRADTNRVRIPDPKVSKQEHMIFKSSGDGLWSVFVPQDKNPVLANGKVVPQGEWIPFVASPETRAAKREERLAEDARQEELARRAAERREEAQTVLDNDLELEKAMAAASPKEDEGVFEFSATIVLDDKGRVLGAVPFRGADTFDAGAHRVKVLSLFSDQGVLYEADYGRVNAAAVEKLKRVFDASLEHFQKMEKQRLEFEASLAKRKAEFKASVAGPGVSQRKFVPGQIYSFDPAVFPGGYIPVTIGNTEFVFYRETGPDGRTVFKARLSERAGEEFSLVNELETIEATFPEITDMSKPTVLGREEGPLAKIISADNASRASGRSVSRRNHGSAWVVDGKLYLRDNGSTFGTRPTVFQGPSLPALSLPAPTAAQRLKANAVAEGLVGSVAHPGPVRALRKGMLDYLEGMKKVAEQARPQVEAAKSSMRALGADDATLAAMDTVFNPYDQTRDFEEAAERLKMFFAHFDIVFFVVKGEYGLGLALVGRLEASLPNEAASYANEDALTPDGQPLAVDLAARFPQLRRAAFVRPYYTDIDGGFYSLGNDEAYVIIDDKFAKLGTAFALSIARHELQHFWDHMSGNFGILKTGKFGPKRQPQPWQTEYVAYLSQLIDLGVTRDKDLMKFLFADQGQIALREVQNEEDRKRALDESMSGHNGTMNMEIHTGGTHRIFKDMIMGFDGDPNPLNLLGELKPRGRYTAYMGLDLQERIQKGRVSPAVLANAAKALLQRMYSQPQFRPPASGAYTPVKVPAGEYAFVRLRPQAVIKSAPLPSPQPAKRSRGKVDITDGSYWIERSGNTIRLIDTQSNRAVTWGVPIPGRDGEYTYHTEHEIDERTPLVIGRAKGSDITSTYTSRAHFQISLNGNDGQLYIQNLSSNGTTFNGRDLITETKPVLIKMSGTRLAAVEASAKTMQDASTALVYLPQGDPGHEGVRKSLRLAAGALRFAADHPDVESIRAAQEAIAFTRGLYAGPDVGLVRDRFIEATKTNSRQAALIQQFILADGVFIAALSSLDQLPLESVTSTQEFEALSAEVAANQGQGVPLDTVTNPATVQIMQAQIEELLTRIDRTTGFVVPEPSDTFVNGFLWDEEAGQVRLINLASFVRFDNSGVKGFEARDESDLGRYAMLASNATTVEKIRIPRDDEKRVAELSGKNGAPVMKYDHALSTQAEEPKEGELPGDKGAFADVHLVEIAKDGRTLPAVLKIGGGTLASGMQYTLQDLLLARASMQNQGVDMAILVRDQAPGENRAASWVPEIYHIFEGSEPGVLSEYITPLLPPAKWIAAGKDTVERTERAKLVSEQFGEMQDAFKGLVGALGVGLYTSDVQDSNFAVVMRPGADGVMRPKLITIDYGILQMRFEGDASADSYVIWKSRDWSIDAYTNDLRSRFPDEKVALEHVNNSTSLKGVATVPAGKDNAYHINFTEKFPSVAQAKTMLEGFGVTGETAQGPVLELLASINDLTAKADKKEQEIELLVSNRDLLYSQLSALKNDKEVPLVPPSKVTELIPLEVSLGEAEAIPGFEALHAALKEAVTTIGGDFKNNNILPAQKAGVAGTRLVFSDAFAEVFRTQAAAAGISPASVDLLVGMLRGQYEEPRFEAVQMLRAFPDEQARVILAALVDETFGATQLAAYSISADRGFISDENALLDAWQFQRGELSLPTWTARHFRVRSENGILTRALIARIDQEIQRGDAEFTTGDEGLAWLARLLMVEDPANREAQVACAQRFMDAWTGERPLYEALQDTMHFNVPQGVVIEFLPQGFFDRQVMLDLAARRAETLNAVAEVFESADEDTVERITDRHLSLTSSNYGIGDVFDLADKGKLGKSAVLVASQEMARAQQAYHFIKKNWSEVEPAARAVFAQRVRAAAATDLDAAGLASMLGEAAGKAIDPEDPYTSYPRSDSDLEKFLLRSVLELDISNSIALGLLQSYLSASDEATDTRVINIFDAAVSSRLREPDMQMTAVARPGMTEADHVIQEALLRAMRQRGAISSSNPLVAGGWRANSGRVIAAKDLAHRTRFMVRIVQDTEDYPNIRGNSSWPTLRATLLKLLGQKLGTPSLSDDQTEFVRQALPRLDPFEVDKAVGEMRESSDQFDIFSGYTFAEKVFPDELDKREQFIEAGMHIRDELRAIADALSNLRDLPVIEHTADQKELSERSDRLVKEIEKYEILAFSQKPPTQHEPEEKMSAADREYLKKAAEEARKETVEEVRRFRRALFDAKESLGLGSVFRTITLSETVAFDYLARGMTPALATVAMEMIGAKWVGYSDAEELVRVFRELDATDQAGFRAAAAALFAKPGDNGDRADSGDERMVAVARAVAEAITAELSRGPLGTRLAGISKVQNAQNATEAAAALKEITAQVLAAAKLDAEDFKVLLGTVDRLTPAVLTAEKPSNAYRALMLGDFLEADNKALRKALDEVVPRLLATDPDAFFDPLLEAVAARSDDFASQSCFVLAEILRLSAINNPAIMTDERLARVLDLSETVTDPAVLQELFDVISTASGPKTVPFILERLKTNLSQPASLSDTGANLRLRYGLLLYRLAMMSQIGVPGNFGGIADAHRTVFMIEALKQIEQIAASERQGVTVEDLAATLKTAFDHFPKAEPSIGSYTGVEIEIWHGSRDDFNFPEAVNLAMLANLTITKDELMELALPPSLDPADTVKIINWLVEMRMVPRGAFSMHQNLDLAGVDQNRSLDVGRRLALVSALLFASNARLNGQIAGRTGSFGAEPMGVKQSLGVTGSRGRLELRIPNFLNDPADASLAEGILREDGKAPHATSIPFIQQLFGVYSQAHSKKIPESYLTEIDKAIEDAVTAVEGAEKGSLGTTASGLRFDAYKDGAEAYWSAMARLKGQRATEGRMAEIQATLFGKLKNIIRRTAQELQVTPPGNNAAGAQAKMSDTGTLAGTRLSGSVRLETAPINLQTFYGTRLATKDVTSGAQVLSDEALMVLLARLALTRSGRDMASAEKTPITVNVDGERYNVIVEISPKLVRLFDAGDNNALIDELSFTPAILAQAKSAPTLSIDAAEIKSLDSLLEVVTLYGRVRREGMRVFNDFAKTNASGSVLLKLIAPGQDVVSLADSADVLKADFIRASAANPEFKAQVFVQWVDGQGRSIEKVGDTVLSSDLVPDGVSPAVVFVGVPSNDAALEQAVKDGAGFLGTPAFDTPGGAQKNVIPSTPTLQGAALLGLSDEYNEPTARFLGRLIYGADVQKRLEPKEYGLLKKVTTGNKNDALRQLLVVQPLIRLLGEQLQALRARLKAVDASA